MGRPSIARLPALAIAALIGWPSSPAAAQIRLDVDFVTLLSPPSGRPHPLADASGRLPLVIELAPPADARALGFQPLGPGFATMRVAPRDLPTFASGHPGLSFSIWPSLRPVLDQSARWNGTIVYRAALAAAGSPISGTGKGVVVGVVDTGLDLAHADFRDATGHTRVAWMLDFSQQALGRHAELEASFGCSVAMQTECAVLDAADIDAALATTGTLPRDSFGHGTHVASIAAGNGGGPNARFVGGAPEATLVIANAGHGSMGNSSDVDIVAGVRFVFDRAESLGLPAVVNLSLGSDFGPHDGTTPLEQVLASMVGSDHPGRAIVVAAGNSGALYTLDRPEQRLGVHTESRLTRGVASQATLRTFSNGGSSSSGSVHVWVSYRSTDDDISIGFDGPSGVSIPLVRRGSRGGATSADDRLKAAIYNGVDDPQGSLAAGAHGAILIWSGAWAGDARMALHFEGEGFVEAWVEATPDGMSPEFVELFEQGTRTGTITVPATHPDLISVGCTVNRTQWTDQDMHDHDSNQSPELAILSPADSVCYFSSAGPTATGARKPEISAPGAMVAASMSWDATPGHGQPSLFDAPAGTCPDQNDCLAVDATHALLSGSSMSAAQVTGVVALLFERNATLTQPDLSTLLEQGARRPRVSNAGSDYQLGFGVLDVGGAVVALDARSTPIAREPDAGASWMSLSDGYAHPALDFALAGAVEVRAADGALADGFEPSRLTLAVGSEGEVTRPLSRRAAGLWEFEVRGRPDMGARSMQIDVRLDGVAIGAGDSRLSGTRSLPIGADRWIAFGSVRAYGGCSASGASAAHFSTSSRLLLLFFLAGRRALFRRLGRSATSRRLDGARRHRAGVPRLIDADFSAARQRHLGQ